MDNKDAKVLIVSNQKDNVVSVINALKHLGMTQISVLDNGLEALQGMASSEWGLVICDLEMRQIDGWTFVKELKLSDKVPNLPILLMGHPDAPDAEEKLKVYGVVKYAKMPVNPSELDFLIHSTMSLFHTSGTIENKFTKAKDSLIKQQNDEAIELYSELKSLTKSSLRSNVGLAQAYLQNDQEDLAAPIVEEIAADPEVSPQKLMMRIRLAFKKENFKDAQAAMKELLGDNPTEFYFVRCVKLALDAGKPEMVQGFSLEAVERGYHQNEFYNCLARCAVKDQAYEEALDYLEKSEEFGGPTPELFNIRGVCLRKVGCLSEAAVCYEEALRLNPTDPKIYFNLALCNIEMKEYDLAIQHLESCIEVSPTFERAREKLNELKGKVAS